MRNVRNEDFQERLGYSDLKYVSKLQFRILPDIPCLCIKAHTGNQNLFRARPESITYYYLHDTTLLNINLMDFAKQLTLM
jgi:hypothetical protein